MEQKTVEQIAEEQAMNHSDSSQHETAKYSFIEGYTTAQQSQPMWREIEGDRVYHSVVVKEGNYMKITSAIGNNLTRYRLHPLPII